MSLPFINQTALITGASRGLGRCLAFELFKRGANIIAVARNEAMLERVKDQAVEKIENGEQRWVNVACDVTDENACRKMLAQAIARFQGIDMAVFNAGVSLKKHSYMNYADIQATFDINFWSVVRWLNELLPVLLKSEQARMVFISSLGRYYGIQNSNGYNPSKAALSNFVECLRADFLAHAIPIRVIHVMPGFIRTEMVRRHHFLPFVFSAEKAAVRIVNGMEKDRPEIRFPFSMSCVARIFSLLPARTVVAITSRLVKE
ncbi:MAG: SDR family NAD(P)-dependent oxidoreductase [Desulfobacteraceae bacterium]|nr:MAG: SDR family NAD(P)-dependent oxidoreductase [Desulfobacteraceae bacterium]